MKRICDIINELIEVKEDLWAGIEEEIFNNMNYSEEYKDLTVSEINKINLARKNIDYIYKSISILDKIKED